MLRVSCWGPVSTGRRLSIGGRSSMVCGWGWGTVIRSWRGGSMTMVRSRGRSSLVRSRGRSSVIRSRERGPVGCLGLSWSVRAILSLGPRGSHGVVPGCSLVPVMAVVRRRCRVVLTGMTRMTRMRHTKSYY